MTQDLETEMREFDLEMGEDPIALNPLHFFPITGTPAYFNRVRVYLQNQGLPEVNFNFKGMYNLIKEGSRTTTRIVCNVVVLRLFQAYVGVKVLEGLYSLIKKYILIK